MKADIEQLQAANSSLSKKVANLEEELQRTRAEQTKQANQANNSSTQDDLKKLAERIQEVDKKRENDKQVIAEETAKSISKLQKALLGAGGESGRRSQTPVVTPVADSGNKDYLVYTIQDGNTLGAIVKACNKDAKEKGLKSLSQKQVMDANPNVNWNRLLVGQKINIPKPGPAN